MEKIGKPEESEDIPDDLELLEKIESNSLSISRVLGRGVACVSLLAAAMPAITTSVIKNTSDYEVTTYVDDSGNERKKHEDQETSDLILYMAGLGPLPDRLRMTMYREDIRKYYFHSENLPDNYDELDQVQIEALLSKRFEGYSGRGSMLIHRHGGPEGYARHISESIMTNESNLYQFSDGDRLPEKYLEEESGKNLDEYELSKEDREDLYKSIWKLMEMCGNPMIRPLTESSTFYDLANGDAHFDALTNTINIDVSSRFDTNNTFAAELAHACQFEMNSLESNYRYAYDLLVAGVAAVKDGEEFSVSYHNVLYDLEGSVEYEAHQILEPKILDFLDKHDPNIEINIKFD